MIGLFKSILTRHLSIYEKYFLFFFTASAVFMGGSTEESRNKIFKQADNFIGKDLRVSCIAGSETIVKCWTLLDEKVITHKDEQGATS